MPGVIAAADTTSYNIVLFLHILAALAAFAPVFIHPVVANQATSLTAGERSSVWGLLAANSRRIHSPALILTGLLGFALSGMSDGAYSMSQAWLILAFLIWIAMNGIAHAVLIPAERAMANGDDTAKSRADQFEAVMAVLLVVMLYLMIFKPGL